MANLTKEEFQNFFKYYSGDAHQKQAVDLLYNHISLNGLSNNSDWVTQYRAPTDTEVPSKAGGPSIQDFISSILESANNSHPVEPAPPASKWPITKQEMADIMQCRADQLPDELMDDFAVCAELYGMNKTNIAYFLGQCGHESAGLRYPMELASGADYEFREDLGNIYPGDGVKYAGTGWIQVTGRYWHQTFSDYLQAKGNFDHKIMEVGKTYTCDKYPWSISGHWWNCNDMNAYTNENPPIDRVGQRVNGAYLPNGHIDRRDYSKRAFDVLGLPYPGN